MAFDPARTSRGAIAGAIAAAAWAVQQPLDRRVFGVPFDDVELLGKLVTRGPAWRPIGFGLHVLNGAIFGAVYASVGRRRVPLPAAARGPAIALGEHLATWPLVALTDRWHPARADMPRLGSDPAAFAQATWRHLLFGAVLGEVERRLNGDDDADAVAYEHVVSTNGHGNIEHAITGAA